MNLPAPAFARLLGHSFICVDDEFSSTPEGYERLPKRGRVYTLIEVYPDIHSLSAGDIQLAGNFAELPPTLPGRGFNLRRFRPCEPSLADSYHTTEPMIGTPLLRASLGPLRQRAEGCSLVGAHEHGTEGVFIYVYSMILLDSDPAVAAAVTPLRSTDSIPDGLIECGSVI